MYRIRRLSASRSCRRVLITTDRQRPDDGQALVLVHRLGPGAMFMLLATSTVLEDIFEPHRWLFLVFAEMARYKTTNKGGSKHLDIGP
jgi:hypothetical protein